MVQLETLIRERVAVANKGKELDIFPWLRFFGNETYKVLVKTCEVKTQIWKLIKKTVAKNVLVGEEDLRLVTALQKLVDEDASLTEATVQCVSIIDAAFAGTTTTSNSIYIYLNIISQHPEIQRRLHDEVDAVVGPDRNISLEDKEALSYHHATMLELLRYTSVAPLAVPHTAEAEVEICGHTIPPGVTVLMNLYGMHHDENFWERPNDFIPERFLDESGQVVSASHPNRRHLMPFSAGPRVCVGEVLAKSRLFLIIASLSQKFHIRPGNVTTSCDPRDFNPGLILSSGSFEIFADDRGNFNNCQ